jgi:hypothetical protein
MLLNMIHIQFLMSLRLNHISPICVIYDRYVDKYGLSLLLYVSVTVSKEATMGSQKSEKFRELAENRTNAILDKIRVLGNLANKSRYEYTSEEINQVFRALENELKKTKDKFLDNSNSDAKKFRFK